MDKCILSDHATIINLKILLISTNLSPRLSEPKYDVSIEFNTHFTSDHICLQWKHSITIIIIR